MSVQEPDLPLTLPRPSRAAVIWAASACSVMSGAAIAPAIPGIEAALSGATDNAAFWARTALILPPLVIVFFGAMIGRMTGQVDQRRGFVMALCALALLGGLGGLATGPFTLLLSRIALGIATAAVLCFATAAIAGHFAGPERATVIGKQSAANTFGGVIFVLMGGLLAQISWQAPFMLYLLALPVAVMVAGYDWGTPQNTHRESPALRPLLPNLVTLWIAMTAFYLLPVQVPFVPLIIETPALAGLVIGCATLTSGIVSLLMRRMAPEQEPLIRKLALALIALGLIECSLAQNLMAYLLAAALIGAGFGALLPLVVRQLMSQSTPATAHAISGLIAASLYAGQVSAAIFAPLAGLVDRRLPFAALAVVAGLVAGLYVNRRNLRPWGRWIRDNLA